MSAPAILLDPTCTTCGRPAYPEWRLYQYGRPVDFCGGLHRNEHLIPSRPRACREHGCAAPASAMWGLCDEHTARPLLPHDTQTLARYGKAPCCPEMRVISCVCRIRVCCAAHPQAGGCHGSHD